MNDKDWEDYKKRAKEKLLKFLDETRKPLPENPDHGCFVTTTYVYSNSLDSVVEDSSMFCRDCDGDRGLAEARSRISDGLPPMERTWHPLNKLEAIIDECFGCDRALRVEYREEDE